MRVMSVLVTIYADNLDCRLEALPHEDLCAPPGYPSTAPTPDVAVFLIEQRRLEAHRIERGEFTTILDSGVFRRLRMELPMP